MARAGDRFLMLDGSIYSVLRPAAETGGESIEMEFLLPSGCVPPPPHVHDHQVEGYEVLEGDFEVLVDGTWRTLHPGEIAEVPIGATHTFRNRSGGNVRVRNWHKPALRFEDYIERIYVTLRDNGITRKRDPRIPIYLSMLMFDYPETIRPARRRERIPMQALARIGRLLPDRSRS